METLTKIPASFTAGTTVKFRRTYADYPADQGWTLTGYLRGAAIRDYVAVAAGASFDFTFAATGAGPPAGTDSLTPGNYVWEERVSKAGEVYTPPGGTATVQVIQNTATAAAGDLQSKDEKDLVVVEAAISGRLTADLESYEIAGRAVKKIPIKELYKIKAHLVAKIRAARRKGEFMQPVRGVLGSGA